MTPQQFEGELLEVEWAPNGTCFHNNHHRSILSARTRQNVSLVVRPPPAQSMMVRTSQALLVATHDPASLSGAAFPTKAQISVDLVFATR